MSTVAEIESAIKQLSPDEIAELRAWLWDYQIEQDAAAGKLNSLMQEALSEHAAGRTKPL
jgi:hypothetical protein